MTIYTLRNQMPSFLQPLPYGASPIFIPKKIVKKKARKGKRKVNKKGFIPLKYNPFLGVFINIKTGTIYYSSPF